MTSAHPRVLLASAVDQLGRAEVVAWCARLVLGQDRADDPDVRLLGGTEDPEVLTPETSSEQTAPDEGAEETTSEETDNGAATTAEAPADGENASADDTGDTGDTADLPTVPVEYADALVLAWGAGDQATMEQLGTAEVVHILGDGGGPNWQQTGAEGAAGSTIVTYEDSESGDVLTLRVDNATASEGGDQAVVEARYETP